MPFFDFDMWACMTGRNSSTHGTRLSFWQRAERMSKHEEAKKELEALQGKTSEYEQALADAEATVIRVRELTLEDGTLDRTHVRAMLDALDRAEGWQRKVVEHTARLNAMEQTVTEGAEEYAVLKADEACFNALMVELDAIPQLQPLPETLKCFIEDGMQPQQQPKKPDALVPGHLYLCSSSEAKQPCSRTFTEAPGHDVVCFLRTLSMEESCNNNNEVSRRPMAYVRDLRIGGHVVVVDTDALCYM